jgi:hypothetical protein
MANTALGAESVRANPKPQSGNLWIAISTALRRHGIPPSRFGRDAVGDPRLVGDLRNGREPRPKMEQRVRTFIAMLDAELEYEGVGNA